MKAAQGWESAFTSTGAATGLLTALPRKKKTPGRPRAGRGGRRRPGRCQVVILDEISHAVNLGLLPLSALLGFVENLPAGVELVLTGRAMPEELTARADLVTEMKEVKHPYQKGVKARRGIEY